MQLTLSSWFDDYLFETDDAPSTGLLGRWTMTNRQKRSVFQLVPLLVLISSMYASGAKEPQIAIMPLACHGIDSSDAAIITDALVNGYLRTNTANVMERQQINSILTEQGFEQAASCDASECAVKVGKLLGIQQIIVGSVGKLGNSYMLNLRRVDVSTGQLISSSSRSHKGVIDEALPGLIGDAVLDLSGTPSNTAKDQIASLNSNMNPPEPKGDLPYRSARVMEVDESYISLNLGPDRSSRYGDNYSFFDPKTNDSGWVKLVNRANDISVGGEGNAVAVSGTPKPGMLLNKVSQWPWIFELNVGKQSQPLSYPGTIVDAYSIIDFSLIGWYRLKAKIGLWIGGGGAFNIDHISGRKEIYMSTDAIHRYTYSSGGIVAARLGSNIYERWGWFVQSEFGIIPSDPSALFGIKSGLTQTITKSFSIQENVGFDIRDIQIPNNDVIGGWVQQFDCGASLLWSPSF